MNIRTEMLMELEMKISIAHEQAVSARDNAQLAIERVSEIRQFVTKMQTDAIKAELAEVRGTGPNGRGDGLLYELRT